MKKFDSFIKCLDVLKSADFDIAYDNEIYRTGIIGQFNLTFEFAWKSLQAALNFHGVERSQTGSPREILQLSYKYNFIDDFAVWLTMLKNRNTAVNIYDQDKADELILLIRDSFISAFNELKNTLEQKFNEV